MNRDAVIRRVAAAAALVCAWAAPGAPLPFEAKGLHVGVATCAGSNCHGSSRPFEDSPVLQNEYFTWERKDAHSNAYKLLLAPEGRRIAANLGLKSAHEAPECLTCHSDYVPADRRGRRYQLSEGVGCEACHGPAQDWLEPHVSVSSHSKNLAAGLYPLENPADRARVCLHCHLGSTDKPITHRIMGAGHPALEFELDTFTNIQPAHFRVDKDYRERKPYAPGAKSWATGQLVAAQFVLDGLASERYAQRGAFPELVFYDCNACHHPMRPPRWVAGVGGPLGPGDVRLADAHFVMAGHVLEAIDPAAAKKWAEGLAELQRAASAAVARTQQAAGRLAPVLQAALSTLGGHRFTPRGVAGLMDKVASSALERDAAGYTGAKQVYYALDALRIHLGQEHGVKSAALDKAVDQLFAAVDANIQYNPESMRAGLRGVRGALAGLRVE